MKWEDNADKPGTQQVGAPLQAEKIEKHAGENDKKFLKLIHLNYEIAENDENEKNGPCLESNLSPVLKSRKIFSDRLCLKAIQKPLF